MTAGFAIANSGPAMAPPHRPPYLHHHAQVWSIALSKSHFMKSRSRPIAETLQNLSGFLDKAEATHAKTKAPIFRPMPDQLAPDMHPFTRQIQLASDAAKGGAARLAGLEAPAMPDTETTFPELRERIAKTVAYLDTVTKEQVDNRAGATIDLPLPSGKMTFAKPDFLMQFSLANFLFHVTTAYALLRSRGVPLGKMDFLAGGHGGLS